MKIVTVNVELYGHKYRITGEYGPGQKLSPSTEYQPPSFEIHRIKSLDGGNVLQVVNEEVREETEYACIRQHQEDLAWAEIEAADRKFEMMKEASL